MKRHGGSNSGPEAELVCFKANLSVEYGAPTTFSDPSGEKLVAAGYFRKFIVTATSREHAMTILSREVDDGEVDWQESELEQMNAVEAGEYSADHTAGHVRPGVLFRGKHFLFP